MNDHWHRLGILLRNCPQVAGEVLRVPSPELPPDIDVLDRLIFQASSAGLGFLLRKHVLSCLALPGCRKNEVALANLALLIDEYGTSEPAGIIHSMVWTCLPVPACRGERVTLIWFLLGCRTDRTGPAVNINIFLPPVPAPEAVEAMESAADAVYALDPKSRRDYCCCSLQDVLGEPVRGRSLGLSFGLAMALLGKGDPWPPGCFATGELSPRGDVLPVGRVREKFAAVRHQVSVFLYPEDGLITNSNENMAACRNLDEALFVLQLAAGGMPAGKAELFKACARNGHLLLENFRSLPQPFFGLPQVAELLQGMARQPVVFLPSMADALAAAAAHNHAGGPFLANLFSPVDIERLTADHSDLYFAAFKWCIGCMSLANHRGDIQGAQPWRTLAERFRGRLKDDDILDYLNHRFVGERFNRFDFKPELPSDLIELLEIEEQRQAISPRDNRDLGAIYGTIAQNFGFCGPAYLPELRRYAGLAITAFGSRYQDEKLRPRSYLVYGLLDAGLLDEAAGSLCSYLGIPKGFGMDAVLENLAHLLHADPDRTAYQAAVTCRALADIDGDGISSGSLGHLALVAGTTVQRNKHPWQLTALNLGRLYQLLGMEMEAERMLQHALCICLAGKMTMRVMALLPLAELHQLGAAGESDYALAREIGQSLRECSDLNQAHFKMLFRESAQPDTKIMLSEIHAARPILFPFSYR